jgi:hypothetical protein
MNIVEAYMIHSGLPYRARNGSILSVTFELLETMLELPSGVRLRHIVSDHLRNTLDFVLESNAPIDGVTYRVEEGVQLQRISPETFVRHQRRAETQRPVPQQSIPDYSDSPTFVGYPFAPPRSSGYNPSASGTCNASYCAGDCTHCDSGSGYIESPHPMTETVVEEPVPEMDYGPDDLYESDSPRPSLPRPAAPARPRGSRVIPRF